VLLGAFALLKNAELLLTSLAKEIVVKSQKCHFVFALNLIILSILPRYYSLCGVAYV